MSSSTNPLELPSNLSPDGLDALTELTTILTRLRNAIQSANPAAGSGGITGATPLPVGGATSNPLGASPGGTGTVTLREASTQTDALKHKIQRTRQRIVALPDMDRDIAEQEEEIRDLEEKIRMQRQVLEALRDRGVQFGSDGDKMETD